MLTETWLRAHVQDSEIFNQASHFAIYRCDRTAHRGGGVLLAISKNISSSCIHITTTLETIWALLTIGHQKIVLGACYRSPSSSSTFVNELHDVMNHIVTRFPSYPLFLLGDFNFPNINWTTQPASISPFSTQASEFFNFCSIFSLTQLVDHSTRISSHAANTLDLILTTRPDFTSDITYLPGISDHSLLSFSFNASFPKVSNNKKVIRDYKKANFQAINHELSIFLDTFLANFDDHSVQTNWDIFACKVYDLTEKFIPKRTITCNHRAPWYNAHLKRLSNCKKRLYRSARKSPTDSRWEAYRLASNAYISALKAAKSSFLSQTLPSMLNNNVRKFWKVINPPHDNSIYLEDASGNSISLSDCAAVLNDTFTKNFSVPSTINAPSVQTYNFPVMSSICIEAPGVAKLIAGLKYHSSPGYDLIDSKFLKNTSSFSSIILTKIFQQSLDTSTLPIQWKIGKVVPLFKSGQKTSPANYRPISLTSTCCKLLEHIIFSHLVNFLESNSFFTSAQHGFRKSLSCETQLISFTHKLHRILDQSSKADCVYLDFSKAFDKVCHKLLLHKLSKLQLDDTIMKWIVCFLKNRSQFVSANNHNSSLSQVSSGVPQGSVLGPLLFLIYINDLPSLISSNVHLFADDCVIFREITADNDSYSLQSDLTSVSNWCKEWLMELNVTKCKVMRVSRTTSCMPIYYLNNTPLEIVSSYKYLGVHITNNLTWTKHIEYIINKANRMLGYLRRNFFSAPSSLKLLLYKTLIRSKLEYATPVWDPCHDNLLTALELVQNNSARFILSNYNRTASVTAMKSSIDLPSLASRRRIFRLTLFHKVYYHASLHAELLSQPQYISCRIDHNHKVGVVSSNTKYFAESFIPKTSREWNHLPADVVSIRVNHLFHQALANIV